MEAEALWEILVPTIRNDGTPIRTRFHRVWDNEVKKLAGGLTIVTPVQGVWVSESGEEYRERMIPVRLRCSREDIFKIARYSKKYYEQEAIMVYKLTDEAYII